ncbi:pseudaminic acid synthase [Priestia megaterium]|uniref:pseudaminic acid synthase n=1 Tax=Priestia megaterium TaxID=1404 RepID=UPI00077D83B2|nr:pseudaminic acid synthase [Priestia megaterium]NGY80714.1 pseudaminic acid synthase [Priestia megaterium]USL39495.1 pseudaminic acid synthase [Priestia megaterium]
MKTIRVNKREIGLNHPPFIIAEMSGNHNKSLDRALSIVEAAAKAGAHGFKIQTYTPDTMTLDIKRNEFCIDNGKSLWKGKSLFELYQEAYTPWEWHQPIFDRCKELGMIPFSTPFDKTSVDFLETLGVDFYKIASFENNDLPLIKYVASKGKPLIVSTGMASLSDIENLVKTAKEAGCNDLILLKCTSSYPSSPKDSNILTIPHLNKMFDCQVGLSDHTLGIGVAVASIALGSTVIEKHFTLNRSDGGVDSAFSLEPNEMKQLVYETKQAWESLGKVRYEPTEKEKDSLQFRRSIYISSDLKAGDVLNEKNIKIIRPGFGLEPKYYNLVLGKKIKKNALRGTPLNWDLIL